jgi:hypothetical protein
MSIRCIERKSWEIADAYNESTLLRFAIYLTFLSSVLGVYGHYNLDVKIGRLTRRNACRPYGTFPPPKTLMRTND